MLLGELDELIVLDTTGADEDHAVGGVVRLDVRREIVLFDGKDVVFRAEDGPAKRLPCKIVDVNSRTMNVEK